MLEVLFHHNPDLSFHLEYGSFKLLGCLLWQHVALRIVLKVPAANQMKIHHKFHVVIA